MLLDILIRKPLLYTTSLLSSVDFIPDTSFTTVSLNLLKTKAVPKVLLDYLGFVGVLVPANTQNKHLETSRTRALSLRGSIQPAGKQPRLVPYETYEQYKDLGKSIVITHQHFTYIILQLTTSGARLSS